MHIHNVFHCSLLKEFISGEVQGGSLPDDLVSIEDDRVSENERVELMRILEGSNDNDDINEEVCCNSSIRKITI